MRSPGCTGFRQVVSDAFPRHHRLILTSPVEQRSETREHTLSISCLPSLSKSDILLRTRHTLLRFVVECLNDTVLTTAKMPLRAYVHADSLLPNYIAVTTT